MELVKGDTLSCGCLRSCFGELQIEKLLKENNILYQKEYILEAIRIWNDIVQQGQAFPQEEILDEKTQDYIQGFEKVSAKYVEDLKNLN